MDAVISVNAVFCRGRAFVRSEAWEVQVRPANKWCCVREKHVSGTRQQEKQLPTAAIFVTRAGLRRDLNQTRRARFLVKDEQSRT